MTLTHTAATVSAHCDTYNGPVITEARKTLETGEVTPLLKWVPKSDESEVKAVFAKVRAVRAKSPESREIADQYFLETVVRIHRASEGAPYTGLKNVPPEPIEALADKALETGNADSLVAKMSGHLAHEVKAKFQKVLEAKKHQNESVEAGRKFVEAYVVYLHYIIGIHDAVAAKVGHGDACPAKGKNAGAPEHHEEKR
jgi:hypothetical protein